ncbi:MAG: DUF3990 domain-containing protein [Bacteroidaceae bacterium]|nr:DUF3990 domain-containing protein [Bacteroidaceae bacterium]
MKLYHGSNVAIEAIDLSRSKPNKDFGRAFYLSSDLSQAQEMAKAKCIQFGGTPCVTTYEVDEAQMQQLAYKVFDCYNHEWARFVYNNRDEQQDFTHQYDIVYGPIADDYVGLQMRKFRFSKLTFEQFLEEIKYPKGITFQYAFCTPEAIKLLQRV